MHRFRARVCMWYVRVNCTTAVVTRAPLSRTLFICCCCCCCCFMLACRARLAGLNMWSLRRLVENLIPETLGGWRVPKNLCNCRTHTAGATHKYAETHSTHARHIRIHITQKKCILHNILFIHNIHTHQHGYVFVYDVCDMCASRAFFGVGSAREGSVE